MKKLTLLLCLVLIFAALMPQYAYAASDNLAKPVGKESYFFSEKDTSTALFAVPYTYCVKVIRDEGEWLYVSYAEDEGSYKKIYGYCKSEQFEYVTSAPQNAYLNKIVTVTYTAGVATGVFNPPSDFEVEAAYYGVYRHGADYLSYVLCRGSFCYIDGANDDYPLNVYEEADDGGDGVKTDADGGSNATGLIIFIIILAVALVAVAALAFTSKKTRK